MTERRRGPAAPARRLAAGLSTAATLGLISGRIPGHARDAHPEHGDRHQSGADAGGRGPAPSRRATGAGRPHPGRQAPGTSATAMTVAADGTVHFEDGMEDYLW